MKKNWYTWQTWCASVRYSNDFTLLYKCGIHCRVRHNINVHNCAPSLPLSLESKSNCNMRWSRRKYTNNEEQRMKEQTHIRAHTHTIPLNSYMSNNVRYCILNSTTYISRTSDVRPSAPGPGWHRDMLNIKYISHQFEYENVLNGSQIVAIGLLIVAS